MITIDSYNLYYNTEHLLGPKPTTYNEIIQRIQPIECSLFYNIISSPNCRYESNFSSGRVKKHYKDMVAEERFKNIFEEKIIYANPKSYFVNKLVGITPRECDEIKSVSFTFSDFKDLPKHFQARGSEFGICLFHDFLQNRGIRPVVYLNESDTGQIKKIVFNSPHLIEVFSEGYDMRWEKEWRISTDLHFTDSDIAFVIVPQERHEYFVDWFSEKEGFEEMKIITSNTYKSYVDHLIFYPQQTDNNWNQVEILRNEYGKGLKIDPDQFNNLDVKSKEIFFQNNVAELSCFAKNTILLNYEFSYTKKFIKFADKVADFGNLGQLFQDYNSIKLNVEEPIEAQRDMVIRIFEALYREYPNTIY